MDDPKAIKKALVRKQNKRNFIIQKMLDAKEQENDRAERDQELVLERPELRPVDDRLVACHFAETTL